MDPAASCNTCGKSVEDRNSIECILCQKKVHLKYTCLIYVQSQYIEFSSKTWHCCNCSKMLFPFTTINKYMLYPLLSGKNYCNVKLLMSSIETTKKLYLFSKFNYFSSYINNATENVINSEYYDTDQLSSLKEFTNKRSLSLFYRNIYSLSKNIHDLEHLIQSVKINFDIIAILDSKLIKDKLPPTDINLRNYSYEYCPTEANAGDTLIM